MFVYLNALKQAGQKIWPKNLTTYFFCSNRYLHCIRTWCENFFQTVWVVSEKNGKKISKWGKAQQTFVGLQDVLKTSSRYVLKTSSTRLQRNNFLSSKTSSRRLEDVLRRRFEDVLKTSWGRLGRQKIVTLKMSWRRLEDMSWICLGNKQGFYWGYLYLTNLNVYLANLYLTSLYLTNLRWIQNALIRTQ